MCLAIWGALVRMVRNFGIRKMRFFRPTRWDQCKAGPLDVSFTVSAINASGAANKRMRLVLKTRSNRRFMMQDRSPARSRARQCRNAIVMLPLLETRIFRPVPTVKTRAGAFSGQQLISASNPYCVRLFCDGQVFSFTGICRLDYLNERIRTGHAANCVDDVQLFFRGEAAGTWKADSPSEQIFSDRAAISFTSRVERLQVHWLPYRTRLNVRIIECIYERIPTRTEFLFVDKKAA